MFCFQERKIKLFKMADAFYFDTSIWLDFYEKRGKNGEAAIKLINKIIKEKDIILYSQLIVTSSTP